MRTNIFVQDTPAQYLFAKAPHATAMDVMQYGVVSIDKTAPVHSAVALLVEKQISGLLVTYQGEMVGILSEKDLLKLLYENQYLPGVVEDYMTQDVVSFDVKDRVSDICNYLVKQTFRRVPILNGQTIAGMVTRADLIKFYRRQIPDTSSTNDKPKSKEVLAGDVMRCGLLTVNPDTLLTHAMDLILKHHVTGLPVVDHEMNLLGLITEKDILQYICNPLSAGIAVQDIMTRDTVCFSPRDSINKICACLIEHSFHRVPIVEQGRLLGIISRSDILNYRCSIFKR